MSDTITARLVKKTALSEDISDFQFESTNGRFCGLEPGAHVDVHLNNDLTRQYSVWNWDAGGKWLSVAVKREDTGRGGSLAMHKLSEGAQVQIGGPRNNFHLIDNKEHITLIAGGIGVTPIYTMARQLQSSGANFQIFYLVRDQMLAAFDNHFRELELGDTYHLHCDATDGLFDMARVMQQIPVGGDVYTCGPEPMLNAVLAAGGVLRSGAIHFERFARASDLEHVPNASFEVELQSTGAIFSVVPDSSILSVLRENGVDVASGCSEGLCGSCIVDVLEGEIDHRDGVLSPEEKSTNEFMCVCVSRAKSKRLVLKL